MLYQTFGCKCKCGGLMEKLDGEFPFVLTEDKKFHINGICGKCHKPVRMTWSINELYLMVPIPDKKAH